MNDYLDWHYNAFGKLFTILGNLFIFPYFYFSVPLHLKTFFSPWKRQITAKKRGLRLDDIVGVISFNLTSRLIGAAIRTWVIFLGLLMCLVLPICFLPVILLWPFIPGLTYFIYQKRNKPFGQELDELKNDKNINNRLRIFLQKRLPDYPNVKEDDILLLSRKRIKSLTGIGTDWAYGYTFTLDNYSKDMTKTISPYPFLLGRDKEMKEIERSLIKSENNNVLIIGEPGIGRHILIETLAHNLFLGKCDPGLAHKRILKLDMHQLFADTVSHDKLKALFSDLLYEAEFAGNIN